MPAFSVQFSNPEMESDEEDAPKTHTASSLVAETEKRAEKTASSSSGREEEEDNVDANIVDSDMTAKGKQVAAEDDSNSSDSSTYLIS